MKYKIIKRIGRGGNGIVYEVEDKLGNRYAKKNLKNTANNKAYQRFKDEISILLNLKSVPGIIPMIDHHFPVNITKNNFPYYIMPLGIPIKDYILRIENDEHLFTSIFKLCETIEHLHKKGITHRDIKPENLLVIDDEIYLSDFGLANFPKKKRISVLNESIGPKWTIAPEMKRISSKSAFKKADIYSLTKTIWMLVTRNWYGFEGQYIPNSNISLDKFITLAINETRTIGNWYYFSIVLLERLLQKGTDNNPDNRPTIDEFTEALKYWHSSNTIWEERNPYEWEDALKVIFPVAIPESAVWENTEEIFHILKILFEKYDNLNHCFYPYSGGDDFNKVEFHPTSDYLIIENDLLIKAKELRFEYVNNIDYSYFRLTVLENDPVTENVYDDEEMVFINDNGDFSEKAKNGFRNVSKYIKGSFLITKKTSVINQLNGTLDAYSGIHNKMTNDEYKKLLQKVQAHIKNHATSGET